MKRKHLKAIVLLFFVLRILATVVLLFTGCKAGYFGAFSVPFLLAYAYENGLLAFALMLCYCILLLASLSFLFFNKTVPVGICGLLIILLADVITAVISLFHATDLLKALGIVVAVIGMLLCVLLLRSARKEKSEQGRTTGQRESG